MLEGGGVSVSCVCMYVFLYLSMPICNYVIMYLWWATRFCGCVAVCLFILGLRDTEIYGGEIN